MAEWGFIQQRPTEQDYKENKRWDSKQRSLVKRKALQRLGVMEYKRKAYLYKSHLKKANQKKKEQREQIRLLKLELKKQGEQHKKALARKDNEIARLKLTCNRRKNSILQERHKKLQWTKKNKVLTTKLARYYKNKRFFEKVFQWRYGGGHKENAEMVARHVVAYEDLRRKGLVNYHEFVILVAGFQLEFFNKEDIRHRFGEEAIYGFAATIKEMNKAALAKKAARLDVYYLTEAGKDRFIKILKTIYTKPYRQYFREA